jgi:RNA polymerase sigma-70 factor (sigma-E family)
MAPSVRQARNETLFSEPCKAPARQSVSDGVGAYFAADAATLEVPVIPAITSARRAPVDVSVPSFAQLYERRHDDMVRLAYLLTSSSETAQDLVQDAFVRVHRAWARVKEPDAYLRRAVVNACNSHHRRQYVARKFVAEPAAAAELGADEISDALQKLSHRQRTAIVLRYWHDCSEAEIADVLGCRPGTVASLLHRGIAELREVIER